MDNKKAQRTLAAPAHTQRLTDRIAELDTDRSAAYDRIAELQAQLQKHEYSIGWTGDQVVGIAELLEQLDIRDAFLNNGAIWRALLANYVEARSKTPEHAADIRANSGLAGVSGEPAQAGGEWTEAERESASVALFTLRTAKEAWTAASARSLSDAALDAVKHRLAAPAIGLGAELRGLIESMRDENHFHKFVLASDAARNINRNGKSYCIHESAARLIVAEADRDFPKPAPKPKTPRELLAVIRNSVSDDYEDALDELVRLAEIGASK